VLVIRLVDHGDLKAHGVLGEMGEHASIGPTDRPV
jgi:hypothetical protein